MSDLLDRAWHLRHSGEVRAAYEQFLLVCRKLAYPLHGDQKAKLQFPPKLLLLDISFLRSSLDCASAAATYESYESVQMSWEIEDRNLFWGQLGLSYLGSGSYSKAFDAFIRIPDSRLSSIDSILARLNLIIAMEGLGYLYTQELASLEEEISRFQGTLPTSVAEQILGIKLRRAFFVELDAEKISHLARTQKLQDQTLYQLHWIQKLPHLSSLNIEVEESITQELVQKGTHWLRNYRARTLNELLHEDDLANSIRLEAKIERLYLWLWRWMIEPDFGLLQRIHEVVLNILSARSTQEITPYAQQMLRNCLRWIAYFKLLPSEHFDRILSDIKSTHPCARSFLLFESSFISYCFYLRDGRHQLAKDHRKQIRSKTNENYFSELDHWFFSKKSAFANIIAQIIPVKVEIASGIYINYSTHEIDLRKNSRSIGTIRSLALCRLLILFKNQPKQKKQGVFEFCFDQNFSTYLEHDQKLRNLLSRGNKLLGSNGKFKVNDKDISFVGDSNFIFVSGYSLHRRQIEALVSFSVPQKSISVPSANLSDLYGKWFTRKELEATSSLSKSTLTRKVNALVEKKKVKKRGQGRNTQYYVASEQSFLLEELL